VYETASFHLNEKAAKCVRVHIGPHFVICSIASSIAILIVKINSITLPALKLAAFSKLVLGLDLVQFDPQLSNKLLISSIGPLTGFTSSPSIYASFLIWSLVSDFFN